MKIVWYDKVLKRNWNIIPKSDLIDGEIYYGESRNTSKAIWDAELQKFRYQRFKFGLEFEDVIEHPEDEIGNHDVFIPLSKIPIYYD